MYTCYSTVKYLFKRNENTSLTKDLHMNVHKTFFVIYLNITKEIEENNRMKKARDLFKIIRDAKRTFHAKMGTIKD